MLEGAGIPSSVNLVFAIRKDLFAGPQFSQSVLGPVLADLPTSFQDFVSFIQKLIEAQKTEKDKVLPKVRIRLAVMTRALS